MGKKIQKPKAALDAAKEFISKIDFKAIDPQREYSTEKGAGLIRISSRRLRGFCKEGRLGRRQVAGGYVMTGAELIAFAKTPRPTGRAGRLLKAKLAEKEQQKAAKTTGKKSGKKIGKTSK